jgi:uncharacterized protein (TIGR03435 family)
MVRTRFHWSGIQRARNPQGVPLLGPSIFAAVQEQLGLKLQRENEQLELIVIDKAQKTPISN